MMQEYQHPRFLLIHQTIDEVRQRSVCQKVANKSLPNFIDRLMYQQKALMLILLHHRCYDVSDSTFSQLNHNVFQLVTMSRWQTILSTRMWRVCAGCKSSLNAIPLVSGDSREVSVVSQGLWLIDNLIRFDLFECWTQTTTKQKTDTTTLFHSKDVICEKAIEKLYVCLLLCGGLGPAFK